MNNKTSLLDAILQLQRTIENFKLPEQAPRDPELLAAYRDLETEYDTVHEQLEDTQRDYGVCKHALGQLELEHSALQHEFKLKMQRADELFDHAEAECESANLAYSKLEELSKTYDQLDQRLQEAQQEIDELEAESESAALALVSEVKNLESELALTKQRLDEVLYAAESETLQLREECQQAKQDSENNLRRFVQLQHTSMLLSEENVKLRATVDELNIEGGWRQTAERERAQRELVEARLRKLEQMFRDVLDN